MKDKFSVLFVLTYHIVSHTHSVFSAYLTSEDFRFRQKKSYFANQMAQSDTQRLVLDRWTWGSIPNRVKPMTSKLVFTASLFDVQY